MASPGARSTTCKKNAQKTPTSPGNCSFSSNASSTTVRASSPSAFRLRLLAQSRSRLSTAAPTASASAFMMLAKKGLNVSAEGLSTKARTAEASPRTNRSDDTPSTSLRISCSPLKPHRARNGVSAMAISGLWFGSVQFRQSPVASHQDQHRTPDPDK